MLDFDFVGSTLFRARLFKDLQTRVGPLLGISDPTDDSLHIILVERLCALARQARPYGKQLAFSASTLSPMASRSLKKLTINRAAAFQSIYARSSMSITEWRCERMKGKQLSTMLNYAQTKHVFSGQTMAAYHPATKPEMCKGWSLL